MGSAGIQPSGETAVAEEKAAARPTILIVEDEAGIARMIQVLLEARGFATLVSHSGDSALARLSEGGVDLILLDVMMPGMDGYEVCRRVKGDPRWRHLPVVMLTAKDAVRDVVLGLEIGADEYIRKPFNTDELVARIRVLLRIQAMSHILMRRNRELQALNAVALAASRSLRPEEILQGALTETVESLELESGLVHLLDPQGHLLLETAVGGEAPPPALSRIPPDSGWAWRTLRGEEPLVVPDAAAEGLHGTGGATRPLAAVRLGLHGPPLGVLTVLGRPGQALGEDECRLLTAMGRQVALALENARLYAETRRRATQFEALYEVGRAMASTLSLPEILGRISDAVSNLLRARSMSLRLLSPDGQQLTRVTGYNLSDATLQQAEELGVDAEANPSLVAVREKRPVVVANLAEEEGPYAPWLAVARQLEYRGFLAVPLVVQDRSVGCLNLYLAEPYEVGGEEVRMLTTLASQAAISIENARLFEETRQLAITDPLTGLANHRQFYDQLAREFRRAQRYGRPLTLLMLDLDRFKQFNDRFGHLAGDQALRETAEVLRQNTRSVDILARYGGEEFAAILPETEIGRALVQADRMRRAVATHPLAGMEGTAAENVTVSIGIASLAPTMRRIEDLVQAADQALYRAKDQGRNRVEAAPHTAAGPVPA